MKFAIISHTITNMTSSSGSVPPLKHTHPMTYRAIGGFG